MSHLNATRPKLVARVRRIVGQMTAIEKALDADAECAEILQQVAAARGAINGLLDEIIEDHLREHVAAAGLDDAARAAGAAELMAAIRRYSN
jgi:DNA-binding FrmR family transcriptional regulator